MTLQGVSYSVGMKPKETIVVEWRGWHGEREY